MIRKLLLCFSIFAIFHVSNAQVSVKFTPSSGTYWYGESTNFTFDFTNVSTGAVVATPAGCGFSVSYTGGSVLAWSWVSPNKYFGVTWGQTPSNATVFSVGTNNCSTGSNNGTYSSGAFSVMSLAGFNPVKVTGAPTSVPICNPGTVTYAVNEVSIPNGGARKATAYQWTIPVGWKFADGYVSDGNPRILSGSTSRSVTLTPDCKTGGSVSVRAYTDTEGKGHPHYSNPASWTISRSPGVAVNVPAKIYCGIPFTASVASLSCVSASAYSWNIPAGWLISGTGNTRTITPTNTSTGSISASIALPGGCNITTPLVSKTPTIEPLVSGGPIAYSGGAVTLSNYPPNSSVSWSVISNSGLLSVSTRSGTGNVANLIPISSSASGSATIRFTFSGGSCPYPPKDYTFWVGKPSIHLYWLTNSFYGNEQGPGGGFEVDPSTVVQMRPHIDAQMMGILEYEWELVGSYNSIISTGSILNFVSASEENALLNVYLRIRNAYGWSSKAPSQIYTRGDEYEASRVYPSPAKDEITIESFAEVKSGQEQKRNVLEPVTIRILDSMGNQVHEIQNAEAIEKVDVSGLKKGYYIIHILKGDKISIKKIQVVK